MQIARNCAIIHEIHETKHQPPRTVLQARQYREVAACCFRKVHANSVAVLLREYSSSFSVSDLVWWNGREMVANKFTNTTDSSSVCEDHLQVTSKIKTTGLNKIAHPDNMSVVPLTINI
ncbi:hypothetical protein QE152_g32195 [Popillia japonica]|uniref:Uncharacterized protein n=1 Tax=Popillia japonica TaxID=7064 RepID=A0AAW1IZQ4_POPJA